MKLGEAMVKDSLITREQLKTALERQVIFGGKIGTNLVELGIIKERDLAGFLSRFFKVPVADPALLAAVDDEVIACISKEQADKYKVVPFKKERNRLHVAMLEPRNMAGVDELRFITRYDIIPYVVTELRLLYALEKYYGMERDLRYISIFGQEEEQKSSAEESKEQLLKVKEQFCNARDKEEIIGILLNESKKVASRAAVFLLKGDKVSGWKSRALNVENVEMTVEPNSVFSDVLSRKNYYRGPLLKVKGNDELISLVGGAPQDCFVVPIQIRDKVIALLYADNGPTSVLDASVSYINLLVSLSSLSFEIVILRNKMMTM